MTITPLSGPADQSVAPTPSHLASTSPDGSQVNPQPRSNRPRLRRLAAVVAVASLAVALGGCAAGSGYGSDRSRAKPSSASVASGQAETADGVLIKDFGYSGELTVSQGQKVTVTNKDAVAHTLTSKSTGLFDTGSITADGGTGTFTAPSKPGSYPFGCTFHPDMAGTLVVK